MSDDILGMQTGSTAPEGRAGVPGHAGPSAAQGLEQENRRLRQENERLQQQAEAMNQQRQTALRRAAEIAEELAYFAYVVSHDLKAPLRGIKLIAEWMCEDYRDKLDAPAREQMALLQSRVQRMHNLIDGVLQYSRIGRIRENPVAVDLQGLLPMIVDTVAPPEHIQVTMAPGLPTITGEKTRIAQVFQNLLDNAVKFMDKAAGRIHIDCVEEAEGWIFRVTDNGPGIEEKHFERIFRIFQTLAPKDEDESTGVGLALVKKAVELHGGRVWVESEVGTGSTFLFTFPKRNDMETTPGPASAEGAPSDGPVAEDRVLVGSHADRV